MFGIRRILKRGGTGNALVIMAICLTLVFTSFAPFSVAATGAKTNMTHTPPDYFVPSYRIQMDLTVSDPAGINLVRCYFKATGEADFVFVPMTMTGGTGKGHKYSGILPAPSSSTNQIEYLFLTVNNRNQIVKSQSFTIKKKNKNTPPEWQNVPKKGDIRVSMELDKVPQKLPGFSDSIVMDKVESGLRFGVVAGGLYYLTKNKGAHASGTAASATTAGTVTAATAGYSTAFIVGAGIVGAAAVGGAAAAVSGGGGGSGGSHADGGDSGSDLPGGTGQVKVTLQWSDCNDLDLHVIDPCGYAISFVNRSAICDGKTGTLDIDANAISCASAPAENIFWSTAPRGNYTVQVDYFSGAGSSSYTVTTIVGGQRQTFTGSISSGTRTITSFTY